MINILTPRIEINTAKIAHNAQKLRELYNSKHISIMGVTKGVSADINIVNSLVKSGINTFADSNIINIIKMHEAGIQGKFVMLRTPIPSQVESVVKYADISLNSEFSVIKSLSKFALKHNTSHKIILMIELGDLREGVMPSNLDGMVKNILELEGIELIGIGTNLACFGGIKPDEAKMTYLSSLAKDIEKKFGFKLKLVSGVILSSTCHLFQ